MDEKKVAVDLGRYERLLYAEAELETVKRLLEADKGTYGLSSETTNAIYTVLEIKRVNE